MTQHPPTTLLRQNGQAAAGACEQPGVLLDAALRRHWKKYRKAFKQCRRKLSSGAVHSLRVETRRLWSLLDLLQPLVDARLAEKARRRFKKVFRGFAQLRDTQVLLQAVRQDVRQPAEWRPFSAMLRRRRSKLTRRVEKCLKKTKISQLKNALEPVREALSRPSAGGDSGKRHYDRMTGIVDRAFGNARKCQRAVDRTDPASIHQMRIAFKKFRYVLEAAQEILPDLAPGDTRAMQSYQTLMGRVQDADVLLNAVEKFHSKTKTNSTIASAQRSEILELRAHRIAEFMAAQDKLLSFWPPREHVRRTVGTSPHAPRS